MPGRLGELLGESMGIVDATDRDQSGLRGLGFWSRAHKDLKRIQRRPSRATADHYTANGSSEGDNYADEHRDG